MSERAEQREAEPADVTMLDLGGAAGPSGVPAAITEVRDATVASPLILRVLTGPLEGADAPLEQGEPVTVGRGFRNDVVLRDKSVGDARISIEVQGDVAKMRVLSGQTVLLGQRLTAPAEAVLPNYLPIAIGASALAVGDASSPQWDSCTALVPQVTAAPANDPAPKASGKGISWFKDIAVGACAFGALALATFFLKPTEPEAVAVVPPTETVRSALLAAGFGEVVVVGDETGEGVVLSGFVASDTRKRQLREQLESLGVRYTGDVRSGEAAARRVSDLFNSNGLPGTAAYVGAGTVQITDVVADQATADRMSGQALADVPYLAGIEVGVSAPEPVTLSAAFTAEIVQVVAGPDGYVVTKDGSRYFAGASTPMGGKITEIAENSVTIEEAGQPTRYTF